MKILQDPIGSCSFRQDSTGSDSRILRPVELNPAVNECNALRRKQNRRKPTSPKAHGNAS